MKGLTVGFRLARYMGGVLVFGVVGCGGARGGSPVVQPEAEVKEPTAYVFRDPLAEVEGIRFAPREPLDAADVPHAAQLGALCSEPLYDEVRGLMGCGTCPTDEGFHFPVESERGELRRGQLRMTVHSLFEGSFAKRSAHSFFLLWEGCEWRSNGVALVTEESGMFTARQVIEGVPFGPFNHCEVARSQAWGDRLICDGTLLTQFAGGRRMRGSTPYASTLTSLYYDDSEGDVDELALKLDTLLLSRDPEGCDASGDRSAVVRSELREFVVKDIDGDGSDDVEMSLEYLFAPAPSKTACWGKEGLKAAQVILYRTGSGFLPRGSDVALVERLGLQ